MKNSNAPSKSRRQRRMKETLILICRTYALAVSVVGLLSSCGGSGSKTTGGDSPISTDLEAEIDNTLSTVSTDVDFTLMVQARNGRIYSYSRGDSTPQTTYRSASTSKMVTAAIVLGLVDRGILKLSDHPQDYLPDWPSTGNLAAITLHHLLNFTSGLTEEPFCLNNPFADFDDCVQNIATDNAVSTAPGVEFYYSGNHLQVAAAMAITSGGFSDWGAVFDDFKSRTGLFAHATYDLPSARNPRVAGGMHWQASEYLAFLRALYWGGILPADLLTDMTTDRLAGAVIGYSPVATGSIGYDWHYGYGLWIECSSVTFDCPNTTRVSSPGAYGAYPFMDVEQHYVGLVAREGDLGTGDEGYAVWTQVATPLAQWAQENQGD